MKTIIKYQIIIGCMLCFIFSGNLAAQSNSDSTRYHIETNDGNVFTGQIIEQDAMKIIFKSDKLGDLTINRLDIRNMEAIDTLKMKNGKYWFDNPQATRYFFSPNGYGLKAGEGYYQNVWVLVNSFAVGITDNVSIGAGIVPLFLFAGTETPAWITPKVSIPVAADNINLGAGALLGGVVGLEGSGFGILYGISTFGTKDNNISLGLGYGYAGGNWAKSPMININLMFRTGARGYFISENYYIQTQDGSILLLTVGGRSIIKTIGLDYGLVLPISNDLGSFFALPWLGITIPFGKTPKAKI